MNMSDWRKRSPGTSSFQERQQKKLEDEKLWTKSNRGGIATGDQIFTLNNICWGWNNNWKLLLDVTDHYEKKIMEKRREKLFKGILFLPAHKSNVTMQTIRELGVELLKKSPYSSDLVPSDYHVFPRLLKKSKKSLIVFLSKRWLKVWFVHPHTRFINKYNQL